MDEQAFVAVARTDEVPPGTVKVIAVAGRSILLCNDEGTIRAVENRCSHAAEPLECGRMRWGWIACPAHGARFDLATGEPLNPPATEPIAVFPARIAGETIEVAI